MRVGCCLAVALLFVFQGCRGYIGKREALWRLFVGDFLLSCVSVCERARTLKRSLQLGFRNLCSHSSLIVNICNI